MLLLVPLLAWAQVRGIDLYARGRYAKAIQVLREEVDNPRRSVKEQALARSYLAASLYASVKLEEARSQLEELARLHPEQTVDPRRFPKDFVQFAQVVRESVEAERQRAREQAERERLQAEAAERLRREQETARRADPPRVERTPVETVTREVSDDETPAVPASSFRLRPEVTGYSDAAGLLSGRVPTVGLGLGVTVGGGPVEATVRTLMGQERWAWELEAGYLFGTSAFQPRVSVRATLFPRVAGRSAETDNRARFGFGGALGGRLALSRRVALLADVGGERIVDASARYNGFVLVVSAGVGVNLF